MALTRDFKETVVARVRRDPKFARALLDEGAREVVRGGKNVFADLGYPDAVERQARLRLAMALNQVLIERTLTQAEAAKIMGVTQPKVSALRRYQLGGFSVERLMTLLTALDQDVEIVIRRKPRSRRVARISVVAGVTGTRADGGTSIEVELCLNAGGER